LQPCGLRLRAYCSISYSDPLVSSLLPALATLLSSPKKDDEISEELAELFGFDAIELVMEVLGNRLSLSYKVQFEANLDFDAAVQTLMVTFSSASHRR
jgi:hypothetical protein